MSFTTLTFFLFLLAVFSGYWALRRKTPQNLLLLAASFVFYAWWDWRFCFLLFGSSILDYVIGLRLDVTTDAKARRRLLIISCVGNLGLLGYFKYCNFFVDSAITALQSLGYHGHFEPLHIILPVGISFYTFQTLSYTIDLYRGNLKVSRNLVDYLTFVSFFPQLVAGPIERASHLLPSLQRERSFHMDDAKEGLRYILWGLFKKMAIADNLAGYVNQVYATPEAYSGIHYVIATVLFAFQIYCDFSAYSDIAIGTARLFGIQLMRNFAYPYFSQSVGEFWRRWHISLSTWFRDYVFIPLGGSRVSRPRLAANLLITFGLSGLWHGANWTYIIWGLLNGLALLPSSLYRLGRAAKTAPTHRRASDTPGEDPLFPRPMVLLRMGLCFAFICLTWVFFRASDLSASLHILRGIATDAWNPATWHNLTLGNDRNLFIIPITGLMVLLEWLQRRHPHVLHFPWLPRPARWVVYTAVIWGTILMLPRDTSPFIYFQF